MNIDKDLYEDIVNYCELNGKDVSEEINNMLKIGFSITKYGNSPFQKMREQKIETLPPDTKIVKVESEEIKILEKKEIEEVKKEKPKKNIRIIKNK